MQSSPRSPRTNFDRAWSTALACSDGDHRRAANLLSAACEMVAQQSSQRIRDELHARYLKEGDRG